MGRSAVTRRPRWVAGDCRGARRGRRRPADAQGSCGSDASARVPARSVGSNPGRLEDARDSPGALSARRRAGGSLSSLRLCRRPRGGYVESPRGRRGDERAVRPAGAARAVGARCGCSGRCPLFLTRRINKRARPFYDPGVKAHVLLHVRELPGGPAVVTPIPFVALAYVADTVVAAIDGLRSILSERLMALEAVDRLPFAVERDA